MPADPQEPFTVMGFEFDRPIRPESLKPDLDTVIEQGAPKLKIEAFPQSATPEFYFYLGWHDLRATQEKFITERKAFLQKWQMLKDNLERLFTDQLENAGKYNQVNYGNGCPNIFYQSGVEDALDVANREPLKLIDPYHQHYVAIPWKAPNPDVCSNCLKEGEQFIWMEEGPCYNDILCSEECMTAKVREYLDKNSMVKLMAEGQIEREVVTLDKSVEKLVVMLAPLPARSNYNAKPKAGFDFA